MAKIEVQGKRYKVVENMGYVHDVGGYAKRVQDGDRERVAVKRGGSWRFWTAQDRVKPLVEHLQREARRKELR